MRLYAGNSQQFIRDTTLNQIADKLSAAFFGYYRYQPPESEVNSWRNSLQSMMAVVQYASLLDHGIILEYQLPQTSKRLDFLITGRDAVGQDNAVIVELKQWSKAEVTDGDVRVRTFIGGAKRDLLHPSVQVQQYRFYLGDLHTAFYEGASPVLLNACSYLHNYPFNPLDPIFDPKFSGVLRDNPVFTKDQVDDLASYLSLKLAAGDGVDVLERIEQSKYRPSKKLMQHVAHVIHGEPRYVLIDEQMVVYDKVLTTVRNGFHFKNKYVVIVKGGPGTGKSVIAINLLADLLKEGYVTQYATGSKAFTETLRKIMGSRAAQQFKYFKDYVQAEPNELDVIIADEAHRLREVTFDRYRPKLRSGLYQIEEILRAARVSVFFIDDHQIVRPEEVGSVEYIRKFAESHGCVLEEHRLETQFRCAGSDGFVNWINNTLGIEHTANVLWTGKEGFDFRIFASPEELDAMIRRKVVDGASARLTAGYCWPWSKQLAADGGLIKDVVIGSFERPWNARPETKNLRSGVPPAELWAHDNGGLNQVGCVYTAQGFEFDYVGVIFGNDLTYDLDEQRWVGRKENSRDPVVRRSGGQFVDLIKNTYRILLSRGMKGCYVHFVDKDTERFFKSRIAQRDWSPE